MDSQFGKNFSKRVSKSDVEATCRKLLGVSTASEVRNSDGFKGTWTPSIETDVNNYIAKLGSTKKFGPHLKRVWKSAGFDDMPEPSAKKLRSASKDVDLSSDALTKLWSSGCMATLQTKNSKSRTSLFSRNISPFALTPKSTSFL
jgi:hypothetical protein